MALLFLKPLKYKQAFSRSRSMHRVEEATPIVNPDGLSESMLQEIDADAARQKAVVSLRKQELVERLFKSSRKFVTASAVLALASIAGGLVVYEDSYSSNDESERNESSTTGNYLKVALVGVSLVQFVLLILRAQLDFRISQELEFLNQSPRQGFWSSPESRGLVLTLLVNCVTPVPWLDMEFEFEQLEGDLVLGLDGIIFSLMLLRAYMVLKWIRVHSEWNQVPKVGHHTQLHWLFSYKAIYRCHPFRVLMVLLLISVTVFGLGIRVYERPFSEDNFDETQQFKYVWNSMWLTLMCMTTVGYGDIYPFTHVGRFLCVYACLWGVFLVSLVIIVLATKLEFSSGERRAFLLLNRYAAQDRAKIEAGLAVKYAVLADWNKKQGERQKESWVKERIRHHLDNFKEFRE